MNTALNILLADSIECSNKLLDALNNIEQQDDDGYIEDIEALSVRREELLHQLFEQYSPESLVDFTAQLVMIEQLDKNIINAAQHQKKTLAQKVIKQRKNTKATSAYLSK